MPIGKVWVYRLLFVCVFVRLRISPTRIKLGASNFARWFIFIGVLDRESPNLGELCSPRCPKSDESASHREVKFTMGNAHRKRRARDVDRPMLTALFVSFSCVFVSYSYFVFVLFS